jgi:hypothetical protein
MATDFRHKQASRLPCTDIDDYNQGTQKYIYERIEELREEFLAKYKFLTLQKHLQNSTKCKTQLFLLLNDKLLPFKTKAINL